MIIPNDYADWGRLARFFTQTNVDEAIATFKEIEDTTKNDNLKKGRAMAWRAYCTVNAKLEGWLIKDWGSGENTKADLLAYALGVAKDATGFFAERDFDILWGLAYAKMANLDAGAGKDILDAIAIADKRIKEGDSYAKQSLSSLRIEAADVLIYQGRLDEADHTLTMGFGLMALEGKSGIDWHHWVKALLVFNKALLAEESADPAVRATAPNEFKKVLKILKDDLNKVESHPDYEFDSFRLHAAAHLKLGELAGKQEKVNKFATKLLYRKPEWTAEKEKYRSRYLGSGDAGILKAKWFAIADELFGVSIP